MIRLWTAAAIVISATFAPAQSPDTPPSTVAKASVYMEILKAPGKAVSRHNPLERDPQAAAVGEKLFKLHCAECHGPLAQGGKKAPSLRADEVQQASSGALGSDQRRRPSRNAGLVEASRATALATRYLHQVSSLAS